MLSLVGDIENLYYWDYFFYFTDMGRDGVSGGLVKYRSFWLWATIFKSSPTEDRRPPRYK